MADARRLDDTRAGDELERIALVFVDEADRAGHAVDELERDVVVVHVVGDRTTVRDPDVRRDEAPAEPRRHEVAVQHPGTPAMPVATARYHELRNDCGCARRLVTADELHVLVTARQQHHRRRIGREDRVEPEPPRALPFELGIEIRALDHLHLDPRLP
jgi:hypothetical protein